MSNEYLEQANKFLKDTKTELTILMAGFQEKPLWASSNGSYGKHYKVKLSNAKGSYIFDFWDSVANMQTHKRPNKYDILACLDTYVDTDMTIDDFAQEYGYDSSNIQTVIDTYNACLKQTTNLKKLFTAKELELLNEIN